MPYKVRSPNGYDSLRPSRRAPLPSLGDTLRCACRFAPGGPGRPTAGLGFVVRSPQPESSRREAVRASQVPVQPAVPMPCSSTPAGPHAPGHYGAATRPPLCPRRRLPRFIQLSRLNRTALGLAVYASPGALPHKTQNSLPAAGQALPGGDWCPAGLLRKVSDMIVLLSRAYLAQGHTEELFLATGTRPQLRERHAGVWVAKAGVLSDGCWVGQFVARSEALSASSPLRADCAARTIPRVAARHQITL